MTTRKLSATATLEGGNWILQFEELRATGIARTVRELHEVATAAAANELGVSPDDIDVDVTVRVAAEAEALWQEAEDAEAESRAAQQRSASLRREATNRARRAGYTYDAIAAAFGVSAARIQQLAAISSPS